MQPERALKPSSPKMEGPVLLRFSKHCEVKSPMRHESQSWARSKKADTSRIMSSDKTHSRKAWQPLADELRKTQGIQRLRELVMLLEEAIFNRQAELALNADKIAKPEVGDRALREVLELMLETKVKKLGFPAISLRSP